jgi:AcrR family transcriptional regulator
LNTKEKILKAALRLFNKHGVSSITVRDIAKEVAISHGNLCYHFPNTNDIIWALYNEMTKKINDTLDALQPDENLFQAHADAVKAIFEISYSYRFFYLHIVEIMQRLPAIKKRHYQLIEERKLHIRQFWKILQENGLFRKDLPNEQYELFITHCFLYGDFWISNSEILYRGDASERIDYYVNGYLALFIPYLTPKGKKLAEQIS